MTLELRSQAVEELRRLDEDLVDLDKPLYDLTDKAIRLRLCLLPRGCRLGPEDEPARPTATSLRFWALTIR